LIAYRQKCSCSTEDMTTRFAAISLGAVLCCAAIAAAAAVNDDDDDADDADADYYYCQSFAAHFVIFC